MARFLRCQRATIRGRPLTSCCSQSHSSLIDRRSDDRRGPTPYSSSPWFRRILCIRSSRSDGTWPSIRYGGKPRRNCKIGGRFRSGRSSALKVSRFPPSRCPTERPRCSGRARDRDKGPRQGGGPTRTENVLAAPSPSWHASRSLDRTARSSKGSKLLRQIAGRKLRALPSYRSILSIVAYFAPAAIALLLIGSRFGNP
jgi:hypothetical protein